MGLAGWLGRFACAQGGVAAALMGTTLGWVHCRQPPPPSAAISNLLLTFPPHPTPTPPPAQVLDALDSERLDQWRWQSFVGEEAALEGLYAEAPDTPLKRCITKARAGRGGALGVRPGALGA